MKKLELSAEGVTVGLTIRHATVGDAMRRGMLTARLSDTEYAREAEQAVAVMIYPRCLACTDGTIENGGTKKNVQELTAAEFIALPYEIGEAWLQAVIEENPGWALQQMPEERDGEKKD